MTQIVVATVNVNGLRAAFRRDMASWLDAAQPDVLLLQEVRADQAIAADLLDGWCVAHEPAADPGRAGVVVAARTELVDPQLGLGTGVDGDQGRWVEAGVDVGGTVVRFASLYLHSASVDHPSLDAKYAYLEHITARMAALGTVPAVVGGDLNIAHREADIKNWKGNIGKSGFLPEERGWLDRWTDQMSWTDVGRALGGDGPGPFTWWSWRGRAFDNDTGWRIDYQFTSPVLAGRAVSARVDRAACYAERFSDHAPMVVTYDI